jgi:hypothetical protein
LSHARPKDPSLLVPVCTIDGVTHYLELKSGKTPLDERSASHGEHCKLCVFGGDRDVALGPRDVVVFVASNSNELKAIPRPVSLSEPANHHSARPRAPPAIS